MSDPVHALLEAARQQMHKAVQHLEQELVKVRAGKATPALLDGIMINYYGAKTPLSQAANINTVDARTLIIKPWDKSLLQEIEKAIQAANIGATPVNDGEVIRVTLPILTEERRQELVKKVKQLAEQARVSVRNIRRTDIEAIRKLQKEGVPEDLAKAGETKLQKITDEFIALVDKHVAAKEKEIMTV